MTSFLKNISFSLCLIASVILTGCSGSEAQYDVNKYYSSQEQDSLKADILTYIALKPKNAKPLSRFEPKYRAYYLQFLPRYHFGHYYISPDSTHYFFMLRPARSAKGNVQRGVGGRFRMNERGRITDFEELYNTPILEEDKLKATGRLLFEEMVKSGDIKAYSDNREYVEWPDDRSFYDKATYEWRYVPIGQ